ncbi:MAG TPA: amidohydrolase family protein [Candidatus Acidoferrales bacterium]|jgi:imidazolonepropionase-like amidohydrolase|nr:amidohydrolase family protein [Candidatus Acidoferrales bacterium]
MSAWKMSLGKIFVILGVAALVPLFAHAQDDSNVTVIKNATILTVTHGRIEHGSILVRDGKIAAVGADVQAPADAKVIDGTGLYVMPGIIDCHTHIAVDGDVNEGSISVSSMVNIKDVLNPYDVDIYHELAGGVVIGNVLHGSANPIGGQTIVIKLKYGAPPDELPFPDAIPGIKFALGENVKHSNFSAPGVAPRYPETRMGVEETIRDAFTRAKAYQKKWADYDRRKAAGEQNLIPPRRDLQLEPLVEVLEGKRYIHCHSYVSDEILMLMRVAKEFGFKVRTFQHVLEGYKVADEMAANDIGGSTFSDWWAYKMEAYEATPYNAALMTRRGVIVSVNSDDADEARHLNQEAAKSMKYGGLNENEALRLVTLNPAIQLGIDNHVGSIEVGKDADFAIYNHDPLSVYAVVQKTIIDGKVYFDRQQDIAQRAALEKERKDLLEKEKAAGKPPQKPAAEENKKNEKKPHKSKKTPPETASMMVGGAL